MESRSTITLMNIKSNEKHRLTESKYIIGRGWLNCQDKRVSHNHGVLKIKPPNSINILSTHRNPIFYKKKQCDLLGLIEQGKEIDLVVGDLFGLAPDEFWFSIEECNTENNVSSQTNPNLTNTNSSLNCFPETLKTTPITEYLPSSTIIQSIKTEPVDTDNEPNVIDSKNVIKVEIKTENGASTSNGTHENTRQCCKYGIRCYRRNPIHRYEQAHPGDSDYKLPNYGEPPLGTPSCPYGARCYRRNPIHFKQFFHPKHGSIKTKAEHDDNVMVVKRQRRNSKTAEWDNDSFEEDPYATDEDPDFDENQQSSESESDN